MTRPIDTTKSRACAVFLGDPGEAVVIEMCDEIDALRAEVDRLKVAEGEAMLVVESQDASIAALKAELAKYTEPLTYEQAAIVCNDYRLGVLTEGDVDEIDAAIRRVRRGE